jgi:serine/threonine-protein kinase
MQVGHKMGPFVVEGEVGAGAMGSVYRAKFTETGETVAIKMISMALVANENAVRRFEREAKILQQLRHPNIVRLHSFGRYKGTPFIVMEYVEGESLDHVLARRGRFSWEDVVHLGRQVCLALQHAHAKGIIHRDLKPSNLMMLEDGTAKLTDFGIAKDTDVTALTGANCTVGTAAYMSPEQCRGETVITGKSDLYSLGVVFFELLTGRKPFQAESPVDMFMKHVNEPPPRPSRLVTDIPVWLDTLVLQMLEKKPEHRPLDAEMVVKALDEVIQKAGGGHSAAVDAVSARAVDRRVQTSLPDEKDREAARSLRSTLGKKKIRKKGAGTAKWTILAVLLGLPLLAIVFGTVLWFALRPPSADDLYAKAQKKMADPSTYGEALADQYGKDGPVRKFLTYHADHALADQVREWEQTAETHLIMHRLNRIMTARGPLAPRPQNGFERNAVKAIPFDEFGDAIKASKFWYEAQKAVSDDDPRAFFQKRLAQARIADLNEKWRVEDRSIPSDVKDPEQRMNLYRERLLLKKLEEVKAMKSEQKFEEANQLLKLMNDLYNDESNPRVKELLKSGTVGDGGPTGRSGGSDNAGPKEKS